MNPDIRTEPVQDWITLLLLASLFLLALCRYYFPNRFFSFLGLPFNSKYMAILQSDNPLTGFHFLISLFQLTNTSLFVYFLSRQWSADWVPMNPDGTYLKFILGVGGWLSLKILLQWFQGYVFDNSAVVNSLIYTKSAYFNYSGLIFFVGNILLAYARPESSVLSIVVVTVAVLINGMGVLTLVNQHIQRIYAHLMYFILYICTLEIAPLILIGGYLKT